MPPSESRKSSIASASSGERWARPRNAVVALFYYLLVAKRMYIEAPERTGRVPVAATLALSVALCALGVVVLGLYPKAVVLAALRVASPLF